jgi:hypothetical protein
MPDILTPIPTPSPLNLRPSSASYKPTQSPLVGNYRSPMSNASSTKISPPLAPIASASFPPKTSASKKDLLNDLALSSSSGEEE